MDDYSLLEDFGLDEHVLEDPFIFGTESIMKDILQGDVLQRSISYRNSDSCTLFEDTDKLKKEQP